MPESFSEKEAAKYLNRSPLTLRDWRERKVGPAYYKVVGAVRYQKSDLDAFVEGCRVIPKGEANHV
jgi:hypothetical protein